MEGGRVESTEIEVGDVCPQLLGGAVPHGHCEALRRPAPATGGHLGEGSAEFPACYHMESMGTLPLVPWASLVLSPYPGWERQFCFLCMYL